MQSGLSLSLHSLLFLLFDTDLSSAYDVASAWIDSPHFGDSQIYIKSRK